MPRVHVNLTNDLLQDLQGELGRRNLDSMDSLIHDILTEYFKEPSKEDILASMREAIIDFKQGNVLSMDEVMAELREEFDFDAE